MSEETESMQRGDSLAKLGVSGQESWYKSHRSLKCWAVIVHKTHLLNTCIWSQQNDSPACRKYERRHDAWKRPPSEQSFCVFSGRSRGARDVASYVTKCHFTSVRGVMNEKPNGRCWNSRPHTDTINIDGWHKHDVQIELRFSVAQNSFGGRWLIAAPIRCFY